MGAPATRIEWRDLAEPAVRVLRGRLAARPEPVLSGIKVST
ncbi:hypothetical protein [Saccharothrix sp. ALI-22-I]|nr:hypothetical protein [Saccharothrix sp. ALI-22-I]